MSKHNDLVRGKTFRWTFEDGPTKGTTYEHTFGDDGVVRFHAVDGKGGTPTESEAHYGAATVSEDVCAVSYKGDQGFTLTAVLNFDDKRVVAFASNTEQWFEQQGTFEVVK
ncbi:MAG: MoaF N-terminal domain-containing protein [Chloroflexi bacterium]|nr:MoaF N-terminal domain-containing protein [Chloroflexota bacterium]